ncbi:hypothetical protein Hanom_Chr16g01441361 [Helianthus anomalus]
MINPTTLFDLINTLIYFEMDITKRKMNQLGYTPTTTPSNMAFIAPINNGSSSSSSTSVEFLVSYLESLVKTTSSSEKAIEFLISKLSL